jgi:hypothetical protein
LTCAQQQEENQGEQEQDQAVSNDPSVGSDVTNNDIMEQEQDEQTPDDEDTDSPSTTTDSPVEEQEPIEQDEDDKDANNVQTDADDRDMADSTGSSDENAWQEYLWLRILVFFSIALVLGLLLMNYLTERSNRANQAAADMVANSRAGEFEKDAPLEEARTKDSVDVDAAGDDMDALECVIPKVTRIR